MSNIAAKIRFEKEARAELAPGTPVRHVDGAIQGSGRVSWECMGNCYRVRWSDGTYSTVPRAHLIIEER